MKVFVLGGTGLLGAEAARELIMRGHSVSSIALPPVPEGAGLPPGMSLSLGDYSQMNDEELAGSLSGCEGLVFAAGVDERIEGSAPVYDMFRRHNIDPLVRLLKAGKACGVRRVVVLGSYFAHFDRVRPELMLAETHPYIRSRVDQEEAALAFASEGMDVAVLELPYVFGAMPGRVPVWTFLVEMIRRMPLATFYPRGGTAMVTKRQVGQCVAGALERNRGGNRYPIGWFNMGWREMLGIVHRHMGMPGRVTVSLPAWAFRLACALVDRERRARGVEGGLRMVRFARFMSSNAFIDRFAAENELGATADDIEAAIGDSVRLSVSVLDGKARAIGMKGE